MGQNPKSPPPRVASRRDRGGSPLSFRSSTWGPGTLMGKGGGRLDEGLGEAPRRVSGDASLPSRPTGRPELHLLVGAPSTPAKCSCRPVSGAHPAWAGVCLDCLTFPSPAGLLPIPALPSLLSLHHPERTRPARLGLDRNGHPRYPQPAPSALDPSLGVAWWQGLAGGTFLYAWILASGPVTWGFPEW